MKIKKYPQLRMTTVSLEVSSPILASSIIHNATIRSSGQEVGASYDFASAPTEENKYYNHEWE